VRIETIFSFVRDAILFDLVDSFLSPEEVVKIGRGACMNKALLLVTLAEEAGISAHLSRGGTKWEVGAHGGYI